MTRDQAIKEIQAWLDGCCGEECDPAREAFNMAISALEQDTVSRTAYLQCARERDTAIEQLKELGYDFGEKIRTDGDTISRQAAIDATWEEPSYTDPLNVLTELRDKIKALPSAQPEIVRCKDCKYYKEYGYVNGKQKFLPKCGFHVIYPKPDDFCSRAERRTDG